MKESYYFAYGSNMHLEQMQYRCPNAVVVENVRLENYRLAFCGMRPGNGVATILPEDGSHVDGVLWKITPECERSLDRYEGYPHLYGKETICVHNAEKVNKEVMVYTMNAPYKEHVCVPSDFYLRGILEGCRENQVPTKHIYDAVECAEKMEKSENVNKNKNRANKRQR